MTDIDQKLHEAIRHFTAAHGDDDVFVKEIKKVFKRAGYTQPPALNVSTITVFGPGLYDKREFATGQVWYERFGKALFKIHGKCTRDIHADVFEAAKRAAGIEP